MSKVQTLRVVVKQRLTAAAEEIFELFERTIAEYEEELCRHRKLLDAVLKPQVQLHRTDIQQLLECKEEDPPEQQERSSSLDQQEPPELPHIKEEQEELWTRQKGEQLPGLEEADIKFTLSPVSVKSEEDDEEKPQSSQLHQIKTEEFRDVEHFKTEAEGAFCGGPEPEPVKDSDPDTHSQPADDKTSHSFTFSLDTVNSEEDEEKPQTSQLQTVQMETEADGEDCGGPEPARTINSVSHLQPVTVDGTSHCSEPKTADKAPEPETEDNASESDTDHSSDWETRNPQVYSEQQGSSCSVCKKTFPSRSDVVKHMRTHKKEKTFRCSVCSKTFSQSSHLTSHLLVHTGETPFSCSDCGKKFKQKSSLNVHLKLHAGGKPNTCSICKSSFSSRSNLNAHMRVHSEEKPFSCSVCGKKFARNGTLKQHLTTHA
ncbi:zinc finger protein 691-like [Acanthopagrus latus]|uniref:zinc finger protein 691-like n=1 Tax=Acanthopagrus latus TaxID=8177 RepID=UPI00187CC39E|nr:zinc finger protein 691-like [Acanthopagrus latus]